MGNKLIVLNGTAPYDPSESLEVYRDISIVADRKTDRAGTPRWMAKDSNVKAVFNSIRNIFSWIPGERVLDPEFGSKLRLYLYEGITETNVEAIISEIRGTCLKWEPRVNIVKVEDASTVQDTEENTVVLDIVFTIPSLSDEQFRYSYVYNRTE